jgi:hypothetical protein
MKEREAVREATIQQRKEHLEKNFAQRIAEHQKAEQQLAADKASFVKERSTWASRRASKLEVEIRHWASCSGILFDACQIELRFCCCLSVLSCATPTDVLLGWRGLFVLLRASEVGTLGWRSLFILFRATPIDLLACRRSVRVLFCATQVDLGCWPTSLDIRF